MSSSTYLQEAFAPEFAQQLVRWQEAMGGDSCWALVDGALAGAERILHLSAAYGDPVHAFEATHLHAYDELGLFLWPLASLLERDDAGALLSELTTVPAVSFIATSMPAGPTGDALAWLAGATTTDGLQLYLRIGDSRVLAPALANLTVQQMARLKRCVTAWAATDRAGRLAPLPLVATRSGPEVPSTANSIVLDNSAYNSILSACLPDMLHAELCRADPEFIGAGVQAVSAHEWFTNTLERARTKGASQFPDQVEFTRIARWNSETFENLPELASTWEALRQGGVSLTLLRQQWTDAQWHAIEVLTQREAQG
ncbi:hypothetical protein ABID97_001792 [Variovorax sp. OAS795]|uniref:DUF4123 domain-containing protein n=1 Tax=Variovorax sp. OAS795 TaxID=3034231 RepID=UPI003390F84C